MAERNRKFFTGNRQGTAYAVILAAILLAGALLAAPALGETAGGRHPLVLAQQDGR